MSASLKSASGCLRLGFAQNEIPVPLFTELYGYGPFLGRRNRGILDPLYCRAMSFSCEEERLLIITNDLVTMDQDRAREVRAEICRLKGLSPANIMIMGSHTHSGPTISKGIGWGELDPVFVEDWKTVAVRSAIEAIEDETAVKSFCGTAPLSQPLGYNRIKENGPTDPDIRFLMFEDLSGRTKLLLHNHGMHGVVFGKDMLKVSADWPGAVNAGIVRRGLADNAAFMQSAAGNINTKPACLNEDKGIEVMTELSEKYLNDLEVALAKRRPIELTPCKSKMRAVEMPCDKTLNPPRLREISKTLSSYPPHPSLTFILDRLEEMALHLEHGGEISITTDFQVFRMGEFYLYAIGGEPFVELGREIMDHSPSSFSMVASIANDNLRYLPTPEVFERYPDLLFAEGASIGYGYYEAQFTCLGRFRAPYKPDIGPFVVKSYLELAESL